MIFFIFVLGLIFGSFLEALTYRVPRGISIMKGRSFCPNCKSKISWHDNIPLLSFLILGGKCRSCREKIPVRAPLLEIFTGVLFSSLFVFVNYYCFGGFGFEIFNSNGICLSLGGSQIINNIFLFLLSFYFIAILVIDLEHKIIPDEFVWVPFIATILYLILFNPDSFYENIFAGFSVSVFLLLLFLVTKGKGMGLGDVKFVIIPGMVMGMLLSWVFIFVSFLVGGIVGVILIILGKAKFGKEIPFAPFLILGFYITLFWSQTILDILKLHL